jgi:hypothetical protein
VVPAPASVRTLAYIAGNTDPNRTLVWIGRLDQSRSIPCGATRKLFEFPGITYNFDQNFADYDVAADGRFLAIQADAVAVDEIHVVVNWQEELRRVLGR